MDFSLSFVFLLSASDSSKLDFGGEDILPILVPIPRFWEMPSRTANLLFCMGLGSKRESLLLPSELDSTSSAPAT